MLFFLSGFSAIILANLQFFQLLIFVCQSSSYYHDYSILNAMILVNLLHDLFAIIAYFYSLLIYICNFCLLFCFLVILRILLLLGYPVTVFFYLFFRFVSSTWFKGRGIKCNVSGLKNPEGGCLVGWLVVWRVVK